MKPLSMNGRKLALAGGILPLLALFVYVVLRSGPLAPVPITAVTVEDAALTPSLFGIGTIDARYTYKIGPTISGRIKRLTVHVGDSVRAGQLLGEMDPVDLEDRIDAQAAARKRASAAVAAAEAQLRDTSARFAYSDAQLQRYEKLVSSGAVSEELVAAKRQERQVAEANRGASTANLDSARQELLRARAEGGGLGQQRANLRLIAPVDGLVVRRDAEPGSTIVPGQTVLEIIDPASLWVNVRFDQQRANGLAAGLPSRIVLRSRAGKEFAGHTARIEPLADVVTEELLAKVTFDVLPDPLPPIGELTEVTVDLPALPATPVVPNASLQRVDGRLGVWLLENDALRFAPVKAGASDLDGRVQILEGVKSGDRAVVYSQRALHARSRVKLVESLVKGTGAP